MSLGTTAGSNAYNTESESQGSVRDGLLRALADLALLPPSLVSPQERGLLDSMLAPIVSRFDEATRKRLVDRLVMQVDGPRELALALAMEPIDVARPLLLDGETLKAGDLVTIIRNGTFEHRLAIAERKGLGSDVADTLIEFGVPEITCRLLSNSSAELSMHGIETVLRQSAGEQAYQPLLLARPELSVRLAHLMFWWSSAPIRLDILNRFTAERKVTHKALADILEDGLGASLGDDVMRLVLTQIRQSVSIPKQRFTRIVNLGEAGSRDDFYQELADAARIRLESLRRIIADAGGEPLAVLAKAIGLNRREFGELIVVAVQNRDTDLPTKNDLERMTAVFDIISTDRADMALHCWDVTMASDEGIRVMDMDDEV
ncbi:MAG: DUF2336 domain-containing protein [Rhizobiales bacterium]|nr:DUF2336 domain-containing protein [Hyphomicrobiales bacterium]